MRYYVAALAVIVLDQITKFLTRKLPVGGSISVLGDFFTITHVFNEGAAFGIFSGKRTILLVIPVILIAGVLVYQLLNPGAFWTEKLAVTLIVSGGIGNMIDRIAMGGVTDMLSFEIFPPVFNVADIAVTAGCALLILTVIFGGSKSG